MSEHEERLIQVESVVAHLEDLVEKLNVVVTEQTLTIEKLKKENKQLTDMIAGAELEDIRNNMKPPPHWGKG